LLEKQWGIKVDSVHIIPIQVDYEAPSEDNIYSKEGEQLLLNGKPVVLTNPEKTRLGMPIDIQMLVTKIRAKEKTALSESAEKMLRAVGFTPIEIAILKEGKEDATLREKILKSSYAVSLNIPMTSEVSIDVNNLTEA